MGDFRNKTSFEKRKDEASRIKKKYPDRVPVVCERNLKTDIPYIDKTKYLVPKELTVSQFLSIIRKRIKVPSNVAIFLLVDNTIPSTCTDMSTLYDNYQNEDGFLYCVYTGETCFGNPVNLIN